MPNPVIVEAVRTPIGKRNGVLSGFHAAELLGAAARQQIHLADLLLGVDHLAGQRHDRDLQRGGAEVDRQDVPFHGYTSNSKSRYTPSRSRTASSGSDPAIP